MSATVPPPSKPPPADESMIPAEPRTTPKTIIFRVIGLVATGLGIIGAFLPVMPTTIFLIIAVWAFARSSPRLERWVREHPQLGPMIADWEERRAVPTRAKILAVAGMTLSLGVMVYAGVRPLIVVGVGLLLAGVAGWLISRPT